MVALNEKYMRFSQSKASEGLMNLVETTLLPGIRVYRFGSSNRPDRWFAAPWWLSFSPFEALKQYASVRKQSLPLTARQCLAIEWGWSKLDVLIETVVKQRLLAWSGTPKTQVLKWGTTHLGRLRPERNITQLYIPGLDEADSSRSGHAIWKDAFVAPRPLFLIA